MSIFFFSSSATNPVILLFLVAFSSTARSDFVNKRSINDWSVRSYRDPITAPPTPFPPRFTVPTRPNQANVPERQKVQPPPPTLPPDVQPPPPTLPPPTIPPSRPTMRPTFPPSVESPTPRNPIVFPSQEQECLSAIPNIGRRGNARPWRQRRKRFALEGSKWDTRLVTYTVTKYPPNISKEKVDAILQQAFNTWQQAADISFSQQNGGDANIEIRFEEGSHGDEQPFDGAQGAWSRHHGGLGHSKSPRFGGDIHFDAGERWACSNLLLMSSLHQIGLAIGLNPSWDDPQSVMFPLYSHTAPRVELGSDDTAGLQKIYGPKKKPTSTEVWV